MSRFLGALSVALLIASMLRRSSMDEPQSANIEVGADGADLRIWRTTEAIRHAELLLGAQASSLTAMESRATSILGWTVAGALALGAAALHSSFQVPALVAIIILILAGATALFALWPRSWGVAGCRSNTFNDPELTSELSIKAQVLEIYDSTISSNNRHLTYFSWFLRIAATLLFICPFCSAISYHYSAAIYSIPFVGSFLTWLSAPPF